MEYNYLHIGALVGQLGVIHAHWINGQISESVYRGQTSYSLVKWTGFSRYHVANILRLAVRDGLVDWRKVEHRPNAHKVCYWITRAGYEYIQELKEAGKYRSCLDLILHNRHLQARKKLYKEHETEYGVWFESKLLESLGG